MSHRSSTAHAQRLALRKPSRKSAAGRLLLSARASASGPRQCQPPKPIQVASYLRNAGTPIPSGPHQPSLRSPRQMRFAATISHDPPGFASIPEPARLIAESAVRYLRPLLDFGWRLKWHKPPSFRTTNSMAKGTGRLTQSAPTPIPLDW